MTRGGRHLVLVGLMGAGKTAVGARCAERLGRPFIDTDALVETATGTSVAELFASVGESAFRDLERRAVEDACSSPEAAVIACGGGAVLDPGSRRRIAAAGSVVWLRAAPARLAARVGDGSERPLLRLGTPTATLKRLAEARAPAYGAVADVVIDTDDLSVDGVADAVLDAYEVGEPG